MYYAASAFSLEQVYFSSYKCTLGRPTRKDFSAFEQILSARLEDTTTMDRNDFVGEQNSRNVQISISGKYSFQLCRIYTI